MFNSRFDRIPACDRRTHGQTDDSAVRAMHSIALHKRFSVRLYKQQIILKITEKWVCAMQHELHLVRLEVRGFQANAQTIHLFLA